MNDFVCFNGQVLPNKEVQVSPLNRGMMYGDGFFETFKAYSGRFLDVSANYDQLHDAAFYLNMFPRLTLAAFRTHILDLLKANMLIEKQAVIRFQCWRKGERGYNTDSTDCNWIISTMENENKQLAPLKLITAATPSIPTKALDRKKKISNGINYICAAHEASKKNADDALMLTVEDFISETTISNVFWGMGNTIYTPSKECDLLPGITRNIILNMLFNSGYKVIVGEFTINEIKSAEFVFTTNSVSEIRSVKSLDDIYFNTNHKEIIKICSLFELEKNKMLLE